MPCRVDICPRCGEYDCPGFSSTSMCKYATKNHDKKETYYKLIADPHAPPDATQKTKKPKAKIDLEGALCDVLQLIEDKFPEGLENVDPIVLSWWDEHTANESEKIKKQALKKLTEREKKVLKLK